MVISSLAQAATSRDSATETREHTIKPNDLTTRPQIPGPDDAAHEHGRLMNDLTVVNTMITRYVLDYADADAGRAEPIPVSDECDLAERLISAAGAVLARAKRRARDERS
jgi:hypothetical protein